MSDTAPPPLGDIYFDPDRTCTRLVGFDDTGKERLCGQPGAIHVDWGDACGFVCEEHRMDLLRWSYAAAHELGGDCGMPGALWYTAIDADARPSSWCAVPDDGSNVAEPVRAVAAVEVSA